MRGLTGLKFKPMRFAITTLVLLNSVAAVNADSDEIRLLQSWGLQWNEQGRLALTSPPVGSNPEQAWQPDLTRFDSKRDTSDPAIDPIVIRSR